MGDSLICMGMLTELMRYIHTLILILMNMCINCKDVFKFINRDCGQITMLPTSKKLCSLMQPALFVYKYIHSNHLFNSHNRVHSSNNNYIVAFDQCKHKVYA